ncbi:hypothetical protein [Bradyrhizobium sp. CW1]|uniref:hypothetical protein n=1 Tax=Bradyrhizobium sp. CW1 TaxID=2782686 RepID=UPI001FFEB9CB|nr:hypothetical protein [Bradyrhizobium sp. CW1]
MLTWQSEDIAIWCVRLRRSLKAAFTAAHYATSAQHARTAGLQESYYFLSYYAAFHGMWSVLFLHPAEHAEKIAEVTHSKCLNVFSSEFASGKKPIIAYDVRKIVEDLKFMREYYSYNMPMNYPFAEAGDLARAANSTSGVVKQFIQLSNLHSHMIQIASGRLGKSSTDVAHDFRAEFERIFKVMNCPQHPSRPPMKLEPSDENALSELVRSGCEIWPHSVMYEHFTDEYMTYWSDQQVNSPVTKEVWSLVWHAFE